MIDDDDDGDVDGELAVDEDVLAVVVAVVELVDDVAEIAVVVVAAAVEYYMELLRRILVYKEYQHTHIEVHQNNHHPS